MSGICAVWRRDDPQRAADMLATVSRGLAMVPAERIEHRADAFAGVGVSSRFRTQQILETAGVLIACDAELYNEDQLRELVRGSAEAPENVRTAALLAALYERFGAGFVERLRGAFSVVLWDRRNRKLLAAIDGFGVGRLVWCQHGDVTVVSSRINAFAGCGEFDLEVNPRAIANVLNFTSSLAPETIFTQVRRLSPGSLLIVSERETREEKYWDMRYGAAGHCDEDRLSRELESLVEQSVAVCCKDDAFSRLGASLSGGTDSSTVVGMMSRMGKGPAKAFSIGFQEQPFNELGYAEIAARKFQADHHTSLVGAEDCFEAVSDVIRFFDEPFANSSAIPTYFCARLAAQNGVNVLLSGDGGDELFGGNERYLTDKIFEVYQAVPAMLRKGLIEPVLRWVPVEGGPFGKARRYIRRSNIPSLERFFSYHFLCAHPAAEVFEQDFLDALKRLLGSGGSRPALLGGSRARSFGPPALYGREDDAGGQRSAKGHLHVGVGWDSDEIPVPGPAGGGVLRPCSSAVEGQRVREALPFQTGVSEPAANRDHPQEEAWFRDSGSCLDEVQPANAGTHARYATFVARLWAGILPALVHRGSLPPARGR